jgi:tRNA pseudouridine55 synthase
MNLKNPINPYEGFLLINKPTGISSFGVVKKVRYLTKVKKVGHAGTLDPFASGLLILALGKNYTKQIDKFQNLPKEYETTMLLGSETNTLDPEGDVIKTKDTQHLLTLTEEAIKAEFHSFQGKSKQVPPMFSAKKVDGKRLYTLARKGITIEIEPKDIDIHSIEVNSINLKNTPPTISFITKCSKGTYIRSLVRDIAYKLDAVAYTSALCRTKIGDYSTNNALDMETLTLEQIQTSVFRKAPVA